MNILLITSYFYPHKGGSQQYAEELYYHLMQTNPDVKVDVITYNTDNTTPFEQYRGMNVYRLPCIQILPGQFAIPNYFALISLLKKLKKNNYVIVNSHTRFFEHSWWTPFAAKYLGAKSVLTDHCANHPVHKSAIVNVLATIIDRIVSPILSVSYDLITVTNKSTYDFVKSIGIKNPHIVYGGVDTTFFKPVERKNIRQISFLDKEFTQEDIIVAFVGRMIHSKGPQLLLEAAKKIVEQNPHIYFIFGGNGNMLNILQKAQNDHILFAGTLEKKQVAELFENADIVAHPSLHHEGFPNVLLEAGAAGCAVIATNKGGTKEIIIPDETGLIVKPDVEDIQRALVHLIENNTQRETFAQALRNHVQAHFDWSIIVSEFKKVVANTLQIKIDR